ncbi:Dehydroquinate synthase-like protein [Stemphylium lycopersici]|nr:Dehydroquinate synthase-like protein [Stemphylium lycopersici]
MLAPVLRHAAPKSDKQKQVQQRVLKVWNKPIGCEEPSLADAVSNFVRQLELPRTLSEVGMKKQEDIDKVAEHSLTGVSGAMEGMGGKDDALAIMNAAKGGKAEDEWLDGGAPMYDYCV